MEKKEIKKIYDDLAELEDKLWKLEKQLNEGFQKDWLFNVRYELIKILLRIREML